MSSVIRFKDIFNQQPAEAGEPLSFKDMYPVEYRPGEDELTNYRAYRRRRVHDVGSDTATYSESYDPNLNEALTLQQRQKRSRIMKRLKSRIKVGRERQKRKMADKGRLQKRAVKQARNQLVKKITKGKSKGDLSFARRQEIEKRLEKPAMKKRIERLAKRMFPQIRRAEVQRKKG